MKVQEFVAKLFEAETLTHIAHLETTDYAKHMALNEFYTGIVELRDRFVESYQGKYGIIKGYKITIPTDINIEVYLSKLGDSFEKYEETLKEGYLKAIIDDINELIYSTVYKLNNLNVLHK